MPLETIAGTTLAVKIAGFLGACASLMFVKVLKPVYAMGTVLVGAMFAHYGVQAAVWYWPSGKPVEEPIAFLIGLIAMNLAGWVMSRFPRMLDDRFGVHINDADAGERVPGSPGEVMQTGGPRK